MVLQLRTTHSMGSSAMQRMWKSQARSRCYKWEAMALARFQKRNETKRRHGTMAEKRKKPEEPKGKVA